MSVLMPKPSVISIWVTGKNFIPQGKFCLINSKPCFVANMTENKVWKNYSGYAIAKRILDNLPRGTQIIYKRLDQNCYYLANKTRFYKKGILVQFGGHSQFVLPIKNWTAKPGKLEGEPMDLPVMSLDKWLKSGDPVVSKEVFNWAYV